DVREERVELRIRAPVDRIPSAAKVQHRRGRNRLPRGAGRERPQELEILDFDAAVRTLDRARDDGDERRLVAARFGAARGEDLPELDALEAIEEVAVERLAPVLAVGDRLEPERFLHLDRLPNALVLVRSQLLRRGFPRANAFP